MTKTGSARRASTKHAAVCIYLLLLCCGFLSVQTHAVDSSWLENMTRLRTSEYLRIDTSNPPGGEQAAVDFLSTVLLREGISFETVETAPGRVNLWARLPASGSVRRQPGIMLLHAMDTAPAQAEQWDYAPLSGELADDRIHGRGALGGKGLGIMHLQAFVALHRAGLPLNRDVIFVAVADQRGGGRYGLGWMVKHLPDLFRDVGYVMTGGGYGQEEGEQTIFHVEVGQKAPLWLRLRATEDTDLDGNAAGRLLDALQAVRHLDFPPEATPPVAAYFAAMAPYQPSPWREPFEDIATVVDDQDQAAALQAEYPEYYDLLRNTCTIAAVNVVSADASATPRAEANVECSLSMHQNPHQVVEKFERVLAGSGVEVSITLSHPSGTSSDRTAAFRILKNVLESTNRNYHVVPAIGRAPSDNHFLRELGVEVYGITPVAATAAELSTVLGANESIELGGVHQGVRVMLTLLEQLARD